MTKRRLLRWSLLLVVLAAFAVWLEPTRVIWGWLRGEAFYQGRPTSYWRRQLDRYHRDYPLAITLVVGRYDAPSLSRAPSQIERLVFRRETHVPIRPNFPFLDAEPDAIPIVKQLLESDPTIEQREYLTYVLQEATRKAEGRPLPTFTTAISGGIIGGKHTKKETRGAWEKAGFEFGWVRVEHNYPPRFRCDVEERVPGEIPAFRIATAWKPGLIRQLPPPKESFGLDLSFQTQSGEGLYEMTDEAMNELVGLNSCQALDIYGPKLTSAGLKHLAGLDQLRSLLLIGGTVTDAELKQLAAPKNLRMVAFIETDVTAADLRILSNVHRLTFVTEVTAAGMQQLAQLESLRELRLHVGGITDEKLQHLSKFKNLETLDLGHNKLTDRHVKHLVGLKNLRSLGLRGNEVTSAGLKELTRLDILEELDVSDTEITDDGAKHFAQFRNLRKLQLYGSMMTDKGIEHMHQMRNLECLEVGATDITDTALENLRKVLPKLKVIRTVGKKEAAVLR